MVTLWDTSTQQSVSDYEGHERRVWSVDFLGCPAGDTSTFASGSDDCTVKVGAKRGRGQGRLEEGRQALPMVFSFLPPMIPSFPPGAVGVTSHPPPAPDSLLRPASSISVPEPCTLIPVPQVWSTRTERSVAVLDVKANVCSVRFNPWDPNQVGACMQCNSSNSMHGGSTPGTRTTWPPAAWRGGMCSMKAIG